MRTLGLLLVSSPGLWAQMFPFPGPGRAAIASGNGGSFAHWNTLTTSCPTGCGTTDSTGMVVAWTTTDATFLSHVLDPSGNGRDVQFFSDAGFTTRLPAEREYYAAGVKGVWHIRFDVPHLAPTMIYVRYGDAGVSTDPNLDTTYGAVATNAGFEMIQHLGEASNATAVDATGNAHNSTANVDTTQVDGVMGKAQQLTTTTGYLIFPVTSGISSADQMEFSCWMKQNAASSNGSFGAWTLYAGSWYGSWNPTDFGFRNSILNDTSWHLWTGVYNGLGGPYATDRWRFYLDGVLTLYQGFNVPSMVVNPFSAAANMFINGDGVNPSGGASYDECRLYVGIHDASYHAKEYASQVPGNTFLTLGTEH